MADSMFSPRWTVHDDGPRHEFQDVERLDTPISMFYKVESVDPFMVMFGYEAMHSTGLASLTACSRRASCLRRLFLFLCTWITVLVPS